MVYIVIGIIVLIGLLIGYLARRDSSRPGEEPWRSSAETEAPFRQQGNGGTHGSGFFSGGGNI